MDKKQSLRTCLVTKQEDQPEQLMRFVIDPIGQVVVDLKAKLPGRGVWLTPTRDILEKAIQRKLFDKGFKQQVLTSVDLADSVDRLLRRNVIASLSLANKAGCIITGLGKVEDALRYGRVLALMLAQEGLETGAAKIIHRTHHDDLMENPNKASSIIITELTETELSMALGKPSVIHAACVRLSGNKIASNSGSRGFINAWKRWHLYRSGFDNITKG